MLTQNEPLALLTGRSHTRKAFSTMVPGARNDSRVGEDDNIQHSPTYHFLLLSAGHTTSQLILTVAL